MRILLVGSDYVWSIERLYKKYLEEAGAGEISLFAAQNRFYEYYRRSLVNKVLFRTGLSGIYNKINKELIAEIENFRPDVIWVFKGMEVLPATLALCREKGIFLVNFNGDNPFIFSGSGSGNKYVLQSLPLYDLHFTYNLEIKDRLEREYAVATALLPFGFDVSDASYELAQQQEEVLTVCFLGNPDSIRAAFIKKLAEGGIPIDVYGKKWEEQISHPGVTVFPEVYGDDFWKTLRKYRVQLNLMRPHNENSHNMRSFEVPGIGGIMLAPATAEHKLFFNAGKEAFLFSGVEDCIAQAGYLLSLDGDAAGQIRNSARQRSVRDGYSYKSRAGSVLLKIEQLHAQAGNTSF